MKELDLTPIYYVYAYIDPRNNKIFYIGKGKNYRWRFHLRPKMLEKDNPKNRLIREITASGLSPIVEKLEENLSEETALQREREWIVKIGKENLTNQTIGGQGVSGFSSFKGRKHTEQTKRLLRELRLGKNNPMYGKKRSEESIQKAVAATSGELHWCYGKQRSEVTKKKISNKLKGSKLTDEQKKQRSESMRKVWEKRRQGKIGMPDHSNRTKD